MGFTHSPRVYIIEGIPGSGKDTLADKLLSVLHQDRHPVYYYPEESVGWSYNHFYWPGITPLRLSIMETALDFIEEEAALHPRPVFVFNRFYLSMGVFLEDHPHETKADSRYQEILKRLQSLIQR